MDWLNDPNLSDSEKVKMYLENKGRDEAVKQNEERQSGLGWAQFAAGIGDAFAGRSAAQTAQNFDKIRANIKDQTVGEYDRQKKAAQEDYNTVKALKADDPNSKQAQTLKTVFASKYKVDPKSLDGMTAQEMISIYGDPGKIEEIKARAKVDFDNDMAKLRANQGFEMQKLQAEQRKKTDPNERLKAMSGTDKARFDNALMVAKAIDEMGAALDEGENTFSLVGDNKYTAAERRAAEAYGRMQSGGAINKDEEERFLAMLPRKTDSAEMQRSKLLNQRDEMVSRLKTLGFTPEEVGYKATDFKYGKGADEGAGKTIVDRQINKKTSQTRLVYSDGSTEVIQSVAGGK